MITKKNRSKTSTDTNKTSKASKASTTRKIKNLLSDDKVLRLVSFALLNNAKQIKSLMEIYNDNTSSKVRTEEEINKFIIDEQIQIKKPDIQRQYYGYCIFYNNDLVGFIIGKKTSLLQKPFIGNLKPNKFDLLFSIGLYKNFRGKGIGTRAIDLFIKMYKKKLASLGDYARKARLYSDIAPENIASIKVFEKNNFHYSHNIKISGKTYKRHSRFVFNI